MGKAGYGVEALRATSGDGLSGFSSRSDQARARELQKFGLTLGFYDSLVESQQNLCADCHRGETQKLLNGKRRGLGLGFGEDGKPDRLICTKCSSRARTAKARDRKENAPKKYMSNEDWWLKNRESLTQAEWEAFVVRENRVLDLEFMMEYHLRDIAEDVRTPITTLLGQVERDVKANGLQYRPDELNFHEHHADINYGDYKETYNYVQYGLCTAVQSQLYWNFVRKFKPEPAPKCMTYGCSNPQDSKIEPWFCGSCSADRKRRSDAHHRGGVATGLEDRPYMVGGQLYTGESGLLR